MALPPLRTVRDSTPAPNNITTPPPQAPVVLNRASTPAPTAFLAPPSASLGLAGPPSAPQPVRALLGELLRADIIDPPQVDEFILKVGPRLKELGDSNRAAQAMVMLGLLTPFQAERVLSGNLFGLVFGNYRIQERVGGGTVGIVFRARHKHLKRLVAVKVVPADDTTPPQFLERFDLEMELLARIDHPYVVRVYDTGLLTPQQPGLSPLRYAVLEHIDGCDLENFVYREGKLPLSLAAEWGRQLGMGLAAAHANNLIHRDFKPSNVLVTADRRAKVSDLGLARHFASIATPRPGIVGSIEFMAPEQVADPLTVGPAADVYALGATLFWSITGQLPYPKAAGSKEMLHQIRSGSPRRLSDIDPEIPPQLDQFLARMMARDPSQRPSALEASGWLAAFASPSAHPSLQNIAAPEAKSQLDMLRFAVTQLEETLAVRDDLGREAAAAVLTALARVTQFRGESPGAAKRLQEYVRAMAADLQTRADWLMLAEPQMLDDILRAIPVRNVGLVGVADRIFNRSGERNAEEQVEFERHPLIGCNILDVIVARHGKALPFARVARDIIRSHHEKWDGSGFPDRLKLEAIPPAARLVAVAEAYDVLRQAQDGEAGLPHEDAIEGMLNDSKGFFDPTVLAAMVATHERFAQVFASIPD